MAGWQVNDERVRWLWHDKVLRVPVKRRKKRLIGIGTRIGAMCLIALWALDFRFNATADGRTLNVPNVIDKFIPEALAIDVDRSIDADHVFAVVDRLAFLRGGAPAFLRFDNGSEFIAHADADWCRFSGCVSIFIDLGSR